MTLGFFFTVKHENWYLFGTKSYRDFYDIGLFCVCPPLQPAIQQPKQQPVEQQQEPQVEELNPGLKHEVLVEESGSVGWRVRKDESETIHELPLYGKTITTNK